MYPILDIWLYNLLVFALFSARPFFSIFPASSSLPYHSCCFPSASSLRYISFAAFLFLPSPFTSLALSVLLLFYSHISVYRSVFLFLPCLICFAHSLFRYLSLSFCFASFFGLVLFLLVLFLLSPSLVSLVYFYLSVFKSLFPLTILFSLVK